MFRGFFDECNRNPEDVRFIMAGWTANVEEWERFTEAWQTCLSTEPSIEYFKSSEANSLSDQFYKFSSSDRDAKVLALSKVIASHDVRGYIALAEHNLLANRPTELKKLIGTYMGTRIYDWAFIAIICKVVTDFLDRGFRSEKIDFIFDACSELRTCIASYERERDGNFSPSMCQICGEAIPGDDKCLAGLQAADLLAGEHSQYLRTNMKGAPYMEIENAKVPIFAFPAQPPKELIERFMQYAQDVAQRHNLVQATVKVLKENGINLNDFK